MAYWQRRVNFTIDKELIVLFTPQVEVLNVMDFYKYILVSFNNILTF